ncbi:MAG: RsmG family class I SAM-dependent methyltransferase [Leptospirales bacterium]
MEYFEKFKTYLPDLSNEKKQKIDGYYNLLLDEGVPAGYVGAATTNEEFWLRHIADSLFVFQENAIEEILNPSYKRIFDIGTGAGLPGVVMAILKETTAFTLIDTSEKRLTFINKVCQTLEIDNVQTLHSSVEKVTMNFGYPELITFRAMRKPLASLELILNVVEKGSKVLYWRSRPFMKNGDESPTDELAIEAAKRVEQLGYINVQFTRLRSPEQLGSRGVYIFEYSGESLKGFPRSWARIKKDLLIERTV